MVQIFIRDIEAPFAVARMGIKNYEGENVLWMGISNGQEASVSHILTRIDEEFKKVVTTGWRCDDYRFYPYLLNLAGFESRAQKAFAGLKDPIEMFFILTRDEESIDVKAYPNPNRIIWEEDYDRSLCIKINGKLHPLPEYIRVGDSENEYPVLLVDEFTLEMKTNPDVLDCTGAYCRGRSWNTSLSSGWRAFDVFENIWADERYGCSDSAYRIVARAKLIPPFWGISCPSC